MLGESAAAQGDTPPAGAPPAANAAPAEPAWRRVAPFVIALALVAFVLARLDLRAFAAHLARVQYGAYIGFTFAFLLSLLAADTFATVLVYRRLVAPVRFRDFFVLRGASYLPSMLNHHVGQAFITVFLARVHRVQLWRVAGATLVVYASWMGCLLLLACVALHLTGKPIVWMIAPLGAGALYLAVLAWRPPSLVKRQLLAPLFEMGVVGHLVALASRVPHLIVLFLGTWIPFWFFGVRIPASAAATYVPILMVVTTLPLTPQGFGTRDVLAALFFEQFAIGATHAERLANIAAATASFGVAITVAEAVLGLLLMRGILPNLRGATALAASSAPRSD